MRVGCACAQDESDLKDLVRTIAPIVENARPSKERKPRGSGALGESWSDNLKKLKAADIFDVVNVTLDRARELVGADRAALFFVDQVCVCRAVLLLLCRAVHAFSTRMQALKHSPPRLLVCDSALRVCVCATQRCEASYGHASRQTLRSFE